MANFSKYFDTLIKHEGGYVNDPDDSGGPTKWGVTLATWIANGHDKNGDGVIDKEDVKLLTKEDAYGIAKRLYWNPIGGDHINNQSIAEFIFDWGYNSGTKTAIKQVQGLLSLTQDGIVGPKTLGAINNADQKELFENLQAHREQFFRNIVKRKPSQNKFLKGWLVRNNSFKYRPSSNIA